MARRRRSINCGKTSNENSGSTRRAKENEDAGETKRGPHLVFAKHLCGTPRLGEGMWRTIKPSIASIKTLA
jgi:hypothetical protein